MTVLIGSQASAQLSESDAVRTALAIEEPALAELLAFDSPINLLALGVPPRKARRAVSVEHKRQQQQPSATGDIDTAAAKSIGPLPTRKTRTRLLRDAATAAATRAAGLPNEVGLSDSPDGEELLQTTSDGLPGGIDYQTLLGIPTAQDTPSAIATSPISSSANSAAGVTSTSTSGAASISQSVDSAVKPTAVHQPKRSVPAAVSFGFASLARLPSQRLALLGGVRGVFEEMARDGLRPNLYTFTALLDLLPPTTRAENALLQLLHLCRVKPDVEFFNLLILRRASRADLDGARVCNQRNNAL